MVLCAHAHHAHAHVRVSQGKEHFQEAAVYYAMAMGVYEATMGLDHQQTVFAMHQLVRVTDRAAACGMLRH